MNEISSLLNLFHTSKVVPYLAGKSAEFLATYLVHSTLLLGGVCILIRIVRAWPHKSADRRSIPPELSEKIWKVTALVGILTSMVSIWFASQLSELWRTRLEQSAFVERTIDEVAATENLEEPATPSKEENFDIESESTLEDLPSIAATHSEIPIFTAEQVSVDSDLIGAVRVEHSDLKTVPSVELPPRANLAISTLPTHRARPIDFIDLVRPVGILFLVLVGIGLLRTSLAVFRLRRCLDRMEVVKGELRAALDRIQPPKSSIRLLLSQRNVHRTTKGTAPGSQLFACGILRWTIVVPVGLEQRLSPHEIKALLAHEVAHLIRRDPFWQLIGQLLCHCLPVQPLNFLARREWQRAGELLCDDWVVERKIAPTALATCLAKLAEWDIDYRSQRLGLSAIRDSRTLTSRIEWLLRKRSPESRRRFEEVLFIPMMLCLAVGIGLCGPILRVPSQEAQAVMPTQSSGWTEMEADLERTLKDLREVEVHAQNDAELRSMATRLRQRSEELRNRMTSIREK